MVSVCYDILSTAKVELYTNPFGEGQVIGTPDLDGWEFSNSHREKTPGGILLSQIEPTQGDSAPNPVGQLYEMDDLKLFGAVIASIGGACMTASALGAICGPYAPGCFFACFGMAAAGALLVAVSGRAFIVGESENGLELTKSLASQILTNGSACLPQPWEYNESEYSKNSVISVGPLQTTGGIRQRYISKRYVSKTSDADYEITYRLSERP